MHRLSASAVIAFAWLTVVSCHLPCDSMLRRLPKLSYLFRHCELEEECNYGEWTEWITKTSTLVPSTQCTSERALIQERWQRVVSGNCEDKKEETAICEPSVIERLILVLGLGSSGHHVSANPADLPEAPVSAIPNQGVPTSASESETKRGAETDWCENHLVCHQRYQSHDQLFHGSRRSIHEEMKRPRTNKHQSTAEHKPLQIDPIPFNVLEHGPRYRRQNINCMTDDTQYILFVLDISGSIGETAFNDVTKALSRLVPFFCRQIKVAVMTFNHNYYVEFCFDCFNNTCDGRNATREAIKNIRYHGGRTHTAGAVKCVCDFMLSASCGFNETATCIDVVFVTDGKSNDPSSKVCTEVQCLHNHSIFDINTYAIGITDEVNLSELECITNLSYEYNENNITNLFYFKTFDEFKETLDQVIYVLSDPPKDEPYVCIFPVGVLVLNETEKTSCTEYFEFIP